MLLVLLGGLVVVTSAFSDCDISNFPEAQRDQGLRICRLENEVALLENAVQELLQRTDLTLDREQQPMEKRKNEFIRFGKRSISDVKRKNEFIRFGKRKNEFIRFGRSDPTPIDDSLAMEKRKNEFIRFG